MSVDNLFQPGRRDVLTSLGSFIALGFLVGCGKESSAATSPTPSGAASGSSNTACTVTPALTEGPYFVEERLNRSDIRTDPTTGAVSVGAPLRLRMQLSQISAAGMCAPLMGALVDMWHCDAVGNYSDIGVLRGQRFLRGYQISDATGAVAFTTIYPGWYRGRAVHIHFKIRTNPAGSSGLEFTSQMFFDESLTNIVHAQPPYISHGQRDTMNNNDGIFREGGSQVLVPIASSGGEYSGTFNASVRI
jgi:protocatechuate 3,4-dioxygenase beta subunit